jgi:hypothetical protein
MTRFTPCVRYMPSFSLCSEPSKSVPQDRGACTDCAHAWQFVIPSRYRVLGLRLALGPGIP